MVLLELMVGGVLLNRIIPLALTPPILVSGLVVDYNYYGSWYYVGGYPYYLRRITRTPLL